MSTMPLPSHYSKHLCEISTERVLDIAPVAARLGDWFLAEVAA